MFASLLRSKKSSRSSETTPLLAAIHRYRNRHNDEASEGDDNYENEAAQFDGEIYDEDHDRRRDGPLLPVFSSEFLDRIPIYNNTHDIRTIIVERCETTLSWDQLRSPQVSQFLVKPIQQQIRAEHFSRGALYCLIANCLQFRKEGEANPGNVGVSKTRALLCELLAMRLLKEFSTRELIDALSYDYDPLQGLEVAAGGANWTRQRQQHARISALEIAIRAQAKKFLAHPLVVQQLEAIWAGTIVFHSVADSLHRKPDTSHSKPTSDEVSPGRGPSRRQPPPKKANADLPTSALMRRTVTLYDPHDSSLFKLSRLRVPRYRNMFSTLSFGIMLGLFLAVLAEKSDDITVLEVVFWFWSAGYMLDEIVGFSEQGFGLYIMSVWNAFDLGILLMFVAYYILRLYGILMPDIRRGVVTSLAYDVLGATAVLLFPRLFSALDHYQYFSQLLIAFRMMAVDLVAILVLIVIACSGFFVSFSMAFVGKEIGARNAAYAIFQLLMGFTPAAWDLWGEYNMLGKALLALFLFMCHFLIVTILITVLTNSFMKIVQNANEEHQFLFAVNCISMVKSDALFSYIPPTNIVGWLLIPLKFMMPFKTFIRMNRTVIKLTHIPILFTIFLYERLVLSNLAYGPTDLVESRGRPGTASPLAPAFSIRGAVESFQPRLREPSITTFHKDRALEEVFRRPYRDTSVQAPSNYPSGRRNSSNVVSDWMKKMGDDEEVTPPQEDAQSVLDRLETRARPYLRRSKTSGQPRRRHPLSFTRSAASDQDDSFITFPRPIMEEEEPIPNDDNPQQTDADGDDELLTQPDDNDSNSDRQTTPKNLPTPDKENKKPKAGYETSEDEFFRTPMVSRPKTPARTPARARSPSDTGAPEAQMSPSRKHKPGHARNSSTNTILFSPTKETIDVSRPASPEKRLKLSSRSGTATPGRLDRPSSAGTKTPKRHQPITHVSHASASRARAILPPETGRKTPNLSNFFALERQNRTPSFNAMALDLASDLGDNNNNPNFGNLNTIPASFTTQFELAARARQEARMERKGSDTESDSNRMSRIMLARMTTLEEGFRDVLKEVKGLRVGDSSAAASQRTHTPPNERNDLMKKKGKAKKRNGKKGSGDDKFGSSV
ncbi:uncharacterized protein M421DRAFT_421149 [Didymella exigua CBS 183.55]|uniref:Uncharacterized protein n=1 Tax=Didymella exigua CBS 183.55 TaxID=1150837 RepID=A0A6A5RL25_9PLEO|nr:uncharacterized protein M421DRAFT_421149 [Didymella exigua CBS 183.55]KAF1927950.1 hypothetical protein M421DRAFT_421149 [Didymella exigua CBS 183.55]